MRNKTPRREEGRGNFPFIGQIAENEKYPKVILYSGVRTVIVWNKVRDLFFFAWEPQSFFETAGC